MKDNKDNKDNKDYVVKIIYNDENMKDLSKYGVIKYVGKILFEDLYKTIFIRLNNLEDVFQLNNEKYVVSINREVVGKLINE